MADTTGSKPVEWCGGKYVVVNAIFLGLAVLTVVIRTWTRLFIVRSFCADDWLMIIAMLLSIALSAVTLDMLNWGLGYHLADVPMWKFSPWFLKLNIVAAIIYCAATGSVKVSILVFYLRIFPGKTVHTAVWTIVFVAAGYNIASILANIFSCHPIAKSWDLSIQTGSCMNRPVFYFANAGLGIFTDFATVLVPIPSLRHLQVPLRQKIAIGGILAIGGFVGIVSCIRLASLYTLLKDPDLTWATTNALLWCIIELNLGITAGSLTAMRPFIRRYFPRLLGLSETSANFGYDSRSRSKQRQASRQLESLRRNTNLEFSGSKHNYSTMLKTTGDNDSEEHILYNTHPLARDGGIVRTVEFDVKS